MESIAKQVGQRIKELRNLKQLSQEELAHRANMHASHIGQIERGEKSPTIDSLEKIVNALDISLKELFSFDYVPSIVEDNFTEKIGSYLIKLNESQKHDVLKIVRILSEWK